LGGVEEGATLVTGLKNPAPKAGVKAAPNPLGGPSMRPPR